MGFSLNRTIETQTCTVDGETAMCLFHSALSLTVDELVAGRFPYKSKIGDRIGTLLSHDKPGVLVFLKII